MIKSSEKQYNNVYRILRVLANQDYLATDHNHLYYILSPANQGIRIYKNTAQSRYKDNQQHKLLYHKECIQIDCIHYYVFSIERDDVVWARNIDKMIFSNSSYTSMFIFDAVTYILRPLLLKTIRQVKEYIDIKNALIIKGQLYLMMLPRGKKYHKSLERSQKSPKNIIAQNTSFNSILKNELVIIREFGLLIWQIIYKQPFLQIPLKQQQPESSIKGILKLMINKQVTYEYLQTKISEQLQTKRFRLKQNKLKKISFVKKQINSRLKTENIPSKLQRFNGKSDIRGVGTQSLHRNGMNRNINFFNYSNKKRTISQIQTGEQTIERFNSTNRGFAISRYHKFKTQNKQISQYSGLKNKQQNIAMNTPRDWLQNRKIAFSTKQKLIKQQERAKSKFQKTVSSQNSCENETPVPETLKFRLINKIIRFKTEQKNYMFKLAQETQSMSQRAHHEAVEINIQNDICKKLQYPSKDHEQIGTQQQKQHSIKQPQLVKRQQEIIDQQRLPKATVSQRKQSKDEEIQFEQINLEKIPQISSVSKFPANNSEQQSPKNRQSINKTEQSQKYKTEPLNNPPPISKNIKQRYEQLDEQIQQIKFQKKQQIIRQPLKINVQKQLTIKAKPKQKVPQAKAQDTVDDYINLINILGNICVKSMKNKEKISIVQWRKTIYFLYERFIFQRQKIKEALTLGVKHLKRKAKSLSDEEWDEWLKTDQREQYIQKITSQNDKIMKDMANFTVKLLKQCSFQRKVEYYIRNRQKISQSSQTKARLQLSKIAVSQVLMVYDSIIENRINVRQVYDFIQNCVFGLMIIAELDGKLSQKQRVSIDNFEKHVYNLNQLSRKIELLYSLYFQGEIEENSKIDQS